MHVLDSYMTEQVVFLVLCASVPFDLKAQRE